MNRQIEFRGKKADGSAWVYGDLRQENIEGLQGGTAMKTLHLVLKSKWYDMIDRGEKKEEYRELTPYWMKRIGSEHTRVCFHKGYTSTTMTFAIEGKSYGYGNPDWGAPAGRKVLKIQLGERL